MSENTKKFKLILGTLKFKQTGSVTEYYETRRFITAVVKEKEVPNDNDQVWRKLSSDVCDIQLCNATEKLTATVTRSILIGRFAGNLPTS